MIKVMIIEDDPMVLHLNQRYVERVEGFQVVATASDGERALKLLESVKVDLLILDIYMPRLDGIGFLKKLRNLNANIDVIMVTAARETESVNEVFKLGAVDYLLKPFDFERFKSSLQSYRERYELLSAHHVMGQEDIDRMTKGVMGETERQQQKGIHKRTLERIRQFMEEQTPTFYTSEEVADRMGVSKVTVRKYLDYLVEEEVLEREMEYGAIGRPSHKYRVRTGNR